MSKQDIEKRLGFAAQGVKETTRTSAKAKMAKRMVVDTITSGNQKHELGYESVMQPVAAGEPPHEWFRPIVRTTNLDTGKSSEKASQPHYTEKSARDWLKNYASSVKPSTDPLYAEYASNREKISKMMTRLAQARNNPELRQKLQAESDKLDARQREVAAQLQKRKSSRPGVKAKFGGHDAFVVTQNYNGSATGTIKGFDSLQQVQAYIKERRAAIAAKATPEEAKTVSWTIYKTIDEAGNSQSVGTVKFARPGAKAKMGRPKTVTVITMMSGTGESRGLFKVVGYDENGREFEYGMFAMRSMAEQKAKDVARWTDSKYISSRIGVKAKFEKEYVLWGLPKGETDRLHEKVLSTQAKTPSQMEDVKKRASAAGWHSFRVQILDLSKPYKGFARPTVKAKA